MADGTAAPEEHLPRYFAKHGYAGEDPKKIKKSGGGKGNWGPPGSEVDERTFNMTNARRRSNSSTHTKDFKTKFEVVEPQPVFEDYAMEDEEELSLTEEQMSGSSTSGQSVEEEHA